MSKWRGWLLEARTPFVALATAILVLNLLSWGFGQAPLAILGKAIAGSWGTAYGIGQVLFKATPLLMAGLAVSVGLKAGLFNIGVEGQIMMGSLGGTVVAISLPQGLPSIVALPLALLAAAVAGGLWAAMAGWMRVRFGAHEVITTIMLNRIADGLVAYVVTTWLSLPATVRTKDIALGTRIPPLEGVFSGFAGSAVSWAIVGAVVVLIGVQVWLVRSRLGRELVWVGHNETACLAQGIPANRRKIMAMALSGAIAGLTVGGTVLGYKGYYELGLGAGAGFGGIAVAFLGGGKPLGLLLAALVFGTLAQAGLVINAQVPKDAMGILEAVVIVAIALGSSAAARDMANRPRLEEGT